MIHYTATPTITRVLRGLDKLGITLPDDVTAAAREFESLERQIDSLDTLQPDVGAAILAALRAGRNPVTDKAVTRALTEARIVQVSDRAGEALEAEARDWTARVFRPAVQQACAAAYDERVVEPLSEAFEVLGPGPVERYSGVLASGANLEVTAAIGKLHVANHAAGQLRGHWDVGGSTLNAAANWALLYGTPPSAEAWLAVRRPPIGTPWDLLSAGWSLSMPASDIHLAERQSQVNESVARFDAERAAQQEAATNRGLGLWRV